MNPADRNEMDEFTVNQKATPTAMVDDYIWGRIDEDVYLRAVLDSDDSNCVHLLAKVEETQRKLNQQLREKVEENHPRLLEQIGAIEMLEKLQSHFDHEVQSASKRANQIADVFKDYSIRISKDVNAIGNLTKLNRMLADGLRCEELVNKWEQEKGDVSRKAEYLSETNAILKENPELKQWKWALETWLFKLPEMQSKTKQQLVERLRAGLKAMNSAQVQVVLTSMNQLLDAGSCQKEIGVLLEESTRELDSLFLKLSSQASTDRVSRLLAEIGSHLGSRLEQFELLGPTSTHHYAKTVSKVIMNRVLANTVASNSDMNFRLLQTIYRSLASHSNSTASSAIKETLNPLKTSMLAQSLARLFALVDEVFAQDEKKAALIVEKVNTAMRTELESVNWDADLLREMEANVQKTLRYIAVKLEEQLQLTEETLRFGGRISRQQQMNYQLLGIAFAFTKAWPILSQSMQSIIEASEQVILDSMSSTVSLVLASMHSELTSGRQSIGGTSAYMGELCGHLKIFRSHIAKIPSLNETTETLSRFVDYVVEQFLLNISLVRMRGVDGGSPHMLFIRNLSHLCQQGLHQFASKWSKLMSCHDKIIDFLSLLAEGGGGNEDAVRTVLSSPTPRWFVVHMLISASDDIPLPHESVGWSIDQYVRWFNSKAEVERFKFLQNLLNSYRQSVITKGGVQYARTYPLIADLISGAIKET